MASIQKAISADIPEVDVVFSQCTCNSKIRNPSGSMNDLFLS